MSEQQSSLPSIITYSEDVSTAPPPPPLPPRVYPAQCIGASIKMSKAGNQYLSVTLRVSPDVYPVDFTEGNPDGTVLSYNRTVIADNYEGRYRMRLLREAFGLSGGRDIDVNTFVGATCRVEVTNEPYEGVMRHQANAILHP